MEIPEQVTSSKLHAILLSFMRYYPVLAQYMNLSSVFVMCTLPASLTGHHNSCDKGAITCSLSDKVKYRTNTRTHMTSIKSTH